MSPLGFSQLERKLGGSWPWRRLWPKSHHCSEPASPIMSAGPSYRANLTPGKEWRDFIFATKTSKITFHTGGLTADRVFVTKLSLFGHKSCGCSSQVGGWRAATDVDTWPRWRGEVALPAKCQHLRGKKAFIYLPITACSLLPLPSCLPLAPWQLPREQPLRGAPRPAPYSPLGGLAPYTPGPSGPNHTPNACP